MLTAGTKAPIFTLKNQFNESISLENYLGKKVVLYFYPKDQTPGCTRQACAFRDLYEGFRENDIIVLGVSADTPEDHKKFIEAFDLPFNLLADPDHEAINKYEVWIEKNNYGKKYMGINRSTYIIDEKGIIEKVFKKANPDTNAEEILKYLGK